MRQRFDSAANRIYSSPTPFITCVWTAVQSSSHADMTVPVKWMESYEASDEWRVEIMNTFNVLVHIPAELLQRTHANRIFDFFHFSLSRFKSSKCE
jgi:hypothetical protein